MNNDIEDKHIAHRDLNTPKKLKNMALVSFQYSRQLSGNTELQDMFENKFYGN